MSRFKKLSVIDTLALSVPYCLGAKVPIPDSYGKGSDGSSEMYQSIL
jgi:hypothetical protein